MSDDSKINELRVTALLEEYGHIRQEVRQWEVLQVISMILAVFVFVVMFTAGIVSGKYILFFVSPAISIFLVIMVIAMHAANIQLGIRSSQVSGQLKKILGVTTIDWENTVGIFGSVNETIFTKKVGKYWWTVAIIGIITGMAPTVLAMWYGSDYYRDLVRIPYSWLTFMSYLTIIVITLIIFYKIINWQKIEIEDSED